MDIVITIWNEALLRPMLNILVLIYSVLGHDFGAAIIVFTILVRVLMMPVTLRQLRSSRKMMALQPKLQEAQKKYAKDRQRLSQETLKAYKEAGVSPLGCLGPMVIQFPIWIGLYQAIIQALPTTPERLVTLSQNLYPKMPLVHEVVPLNGTFLWLDLGFPDPTPVLPVLVAASMWALQKMTMTTTVDPKQASMNNMMLWMMPLMFGFFTFTFPAGLAVYWVFSNIVSIVMQYFVTGWGGLTTLFQRKVPVPAATTATPAPAPSQTPPTSGKETAKDEQRRDLSQDRRRSHRDRHQGARRPARRGRGGGHKQR